MYRLCHSAAIALLIISIFSYGSCHKDLPLTQLGNWVQSASIMNYPRAYASSFVIGDNAYVGLGYNELVNTPMRRLNDFYKFNVDSGWSQIEDFPGLARSQAASFSVGNCGYVGTGWDGLNKFNDFYQYDPSAPAGQRWKPKASFPGPARYDAVGFGLQGKGYIGTGFNLFWMNDFYEYDPNSDSWRLTVGTSGNFSKRQGASAFIYKNKAYIVGGSVSGGMAKDFWSFDPSQKVPWTQLNDIVNAGKGGFDAGYTNIQRANGVAVVNGNYAYFTTGINVSTQASTWQYDFSNDTWSPRTPYPRSPRYGAVGFTISGKSYIGAGFTGNATLDDFSQFVPDQAYNPND